MPTCAGREERRRLRVSGTVQGVGFRPFVFRHAVELGLSGWVLNDTSGVLIEVQGAPDRVAELIRVLVEEAPPLANVTSIETETIALNGGGEFRIVDSVRTVSTGAAVSVDTGTCPECLAEVRDPMDRRYRYPFTNCTNCGPRYTIVRAVPYDRPDTTMSDFVMCAACAAEYHDPADRRFHAQPNACPACGPQLSWVVPSAASRAPVIATAALDAAVAAIGHGDVIAVKGVGGYHLVADATNDAAVDRLRFRKARDEKPFALMVATIEEAASLCELDVAAVAALSSPRRPIVLAPRRPDAVVADGIAPGLAELGVMLPYSPLHHLLLDAVRRPLVMTSGNVSDEPIAHDDADAIERLGPLVDGLLMHDRPIHIRCDDSVVRADGGDLRVVRRSRGYAPERLPLPFETSARVLAVGAELKSTIAVAASDWVVPSHHIGDLHHLATYRAFLQAVEHLPRLFGVDVDVVAHDMHPEYLSTKFALGLDVPAVAVQHHHAHIAACMVEHGRAAPVLGLAFDGLGYGPDGTMWGGELLVADLRGFRRVGHLRQVRMPGGEAAIREPWRMAAVWSAHAAGADVAIALAARRGIDATTATTMLQIAELEQSPVTSSVGRLFDAVASILGVRQRVSYEGQAAIGLEAIARRSGDPRRYAPPLVQRSDSVSCIDPRPLLDGIIADVFVGVDPPDIAAGFHLALARGVVAAALDAAATNDLDTVALSGGVFQNALFTGAVADGLRAAGVTVLTHRAIPPNDGGVSVGQAAVAACATMVASPGQP